MRQLYYHFSYPLVKYFVQILKHLGHDTNNKTLEHLIYYYHHYQKYRKSPGKFRFILHNNINFNYLIVVDIIYINSIPLLYIVDEGT